MSVTENYLEKHRDSMEEAPPTFQSPDFPMNAWYAAAWDVELKHELLARTICGRHLVLYRRADGRAGRAGGCLLASPAAALEGQAATATTWSAATTG